MNGLPGIPEKGSHEAKIINHLEDHRSIPLVFSLVTKTQPIRLVTKFHGRKDKSLTVQKQKLDKPTWLKILKNIFEALEHVHSEGMLHNDLKTNNVMEQRKSEWNPVIIDFGKACVACDPKPVKSLSVSRQQEYRRKYPHITSGISSGSSLGHGHGQSAKTY